MTENQLRDMMTSAVADVVVVRNLAEKAVAGGKHIQRRRRRLVASVTAAGLISAVVAVSFVATGTTTGGTARLIPAGPSGPVHQTPHPPVQPTSTPTSTPTFTPTSTPAVSMACPSQLPVAWAKRLQAGNIPLPQGLSVVPFAISPDGSHVYATVWGPGWSGVAAISRDGGVRRIHAFPAGAGQVSWGDASDHDLVWLESYSATDLSQVALFTWNAASNAVLELAAPPVNGQSIPTSQGFPTVAGSHATWVDSVDGEHSRVHLYDLTSHTDRIVFTGHASMSTLAGNWLVWTGGSQPNQPAKLHFIDVNTGAGLPTPTPLEKVTGVAGVAGDNGTLTWIGDNGHTVYTWKTGMAAPRVLFQTGSGDFADYPIASGRYVLWTGSGSAYIADVTTGGVATLAGWTTGQLVIGGTFVVMNTGPTNTAKAAHPVNPVSVLDTAGLTDLPSCNAAGPPAG